MDTRAGFPATVIALALMTPLALSAVPPQQPSLAAVAAQGAMPIVLHAPSLLDSIDTIAGQHVRVLDARVLEIIEPRAILVEANTHYRTLRGQRDRILVFTADRGDANVGPLAIGSPVIVEGIARTLLSVRATSDVAWPASLDPDDVNELEVRGAIVRAAIITAEGTEIAGSSREVRRSGGAYRR